MVQTDARFPDWEPNDKTQKGEILMHLDYAHEKQAEAQGIKWGIWNFSYWKRKYNRAELLRIHREYHIKFVKETESNICPYCEYVMTPTEGASEMGEDGVCKVWCSKCGEEYRYKEGSE